jgi:hypothetical protein
LWRANLRLVHGQGAILIGTGLNINKPLASSYCSFMIDRFGRAIIEMI